MKNTQRIRYKIMVNTMSHSDIFTVAQRIFNENEWHINNVKDFKSRITPSNKKKITEKKGIKNAHHWKMRMKLERAPCTSYTYTCTTVRQFSAKSKIELGQGYFCALTPAQSAHCTVYAIFVVHFFPLCVAAPICVFSGFGIEIVFGVYSMQLVPSNWRSSSCTLHNM